MITKALEEIRRGTAEIIDIEAIEKLVTRYYETGETYTVKAGFDPTGADLHLGHTVLLQKLKIFQAHGGRVQLLIGDFTATIGDDTNAIIFAIVFALIFVIIGSIPLSGLFKPVTTSYQYILYQSYIDRKSSKALSSRLDKKTQDIIKAAFK